MNEGIESINVLYVDSQADSKNITEVAQSCGMIDALTSSHAASHTGFSRSCRVALCDDFRVAVVVVGVVVVLLSAERVYSGGMVGGSRLLRFHGGGHEHGERGGRHMRGLVDGSWLLCHRPSESRHLGEQ